MTRYQQAIDRIEKRPRKLKKVCKDADDPHESLRIIKDLRRIAQILDQGKGRRCCGLAANQLGHDARIFVLKNARGKFEAFTNPIVLEGFGQRKSVEGCFSFPDQEFTIDRFVSVRTMSDGGARRFTGLMAIVYQHEVDHLNGRVLK